MTTKFFRWMRNTRQDKDYALIWEAEVLPGILPGWQHAGLMRAFSTDTERNCLSYAAVHIESGLAIAYSDFSREHCIHTAKMRIKKFGKSAAALEYHCFEKQQALQAILTPAQRAWHEEWMHDLRNM